MTVLIIIGLLACILHALGSVAIECAPLGYEDETGFHYGEPED